MRAFIVAVLALAGCSSTPGYLVVPGERIGAVFIGMPAKDVIEALGAPRESTRLPNRTVNEFADGLTVVVREADQRVISIGTTDAWYRTAAGVGAGATEFEVRAQLAGTPQVVEDRKNARIKTLCYPGMELDFWPQQKGVAALRVTSLPCLGQS
jgi:hypothetical protein